MWPQRMYPDGKYYFWQIQQWATPPPPPSRLAAIFAGLELTRLLNVAHFEGKVQAMFHANLVPYVHSGRIHMQAYSTATMRLPW